MNNFLLAPNPLPPHITVSDSALVKGEQYHWFDSKGTYLSGVFVKWDRSEDGYSYGGYFVSVYRYNNASEIIEKMDNYFDNPNTYYSDK